MLLALLLLIGCHVWAQEDEIEFKIAKLKTPILYEVPRHDIRVREDKPLNTSARDSQAQMLNWGTKYEYRLRNADYKDVQDVEASRGRVFRRDSIITLSLPYAPTAFVDSCMLSIRFKPSARVDTMVLNRKLYIAANLKANRPYTPINNGKRGLYIRWAHGTIAYSMYHQYANWGVLHHVRKSRFTDLANTALWFQNYSSKDTMPRSFDSISAVLTVNKKFRKYHLTGSAITPELMSAIENMHRGDRMRLRVYYKDLEKDEERRKNLYFRISNINRDEILN